MRLSSPRPRRAAEGFFEATRERGDAVGEHSLRQPGKRVNKIFALFLQHVDCALTILAQYWSRDFTTTVKSPFETCV